MHMGNMTLKEFHLHDWVMIKDHSYSNRKKYLIMCIIIIRFLINMQVQGQYPHQRDPFQVAGLLHPWQISHQVTLS